MENNLFTYAASELSQNAFLCWLVSFGKTKEANAESPEGLALRVCAYDFLRAAMPNEELDVRRQHLHTDVLAMINDHLAEFYASVKLYETMPVLEWGPSQICGFFESLRIGINKPDYNIHYDYVSTPADGFYIMWFFAPKCYVSIKGIYCGLYLQIVANNGYFNINLKIKTPGGSTFADKNLSCSTFSNIIMYDMDGTYRPGKYNFQPPSCFHHGYTMAIGKYNGTPTPKNNPAMKADGARELVISALKDYENILDSYNGLVIA